MVEAMAAAEIDDESHRHAAGERAVRQFDLRPVMALDGLHIHVGHARL